ncbi:MAG: two-component sensor histidine kinase [Zoogloeaceae bacterium]|jgi:two-component system sensor histidine kinase RstB|nr:two-component sensor histidine kinase [Zoogloeaceae bacterium]
MIGVESAATVIRQARRFLFPPRRRRGRHSRRDYEQHYSLRVFCRFYLILLCGFVLIVCLAHLLVASAVRDVEEHHARRFMQGAFTLVETELYRHAREDWLSAIEALNEKFTHHLYLIGRAHLPKEIQTQVSQGGIVVSREHNEMYHMLSDNDTVLALGMFSPAHGPGAALKTPLRLHAHLSIWAASGAAFALLLFIWIRPIFRDLEALRQTTRALGEGRLEARTPGAYSRIFVPLTDSLNDMADRIQQRIATQKELTCAMSHELRTPIARLRFVGEMAVSARAREERQRLGKMMESDLDELERLIDASLTYARLERDTLQLHPETVDLARWLTEEAEKLRPLLRGKTLSLDLRELAPEQNVTLDPQYMARALGNLVRNAVRYARQHIKISASVKNRMASIHVDDDGVGVPEEKREAIFTAFSRLDRACDRATSGYGLGLAITLRILTLHCGHARVLSSSLGGARFSLKWPLPES